MEKRKIPLKSYVTMVILIVLGIFAYFAVEQGKASKVTKILYRLGYKKVSDVKVYGITKVEDMKTKIRGIRYFVIFKDIQTNRYCRGFVLKDFKNNVKQDITCKKGR